MFPYPCQCHSTVAVLERTPFPPVCVLVLTCSLGTRRGEGKAPTHKPLKYAGLLQKVRVGMMRATVLVQIQRNLHGIVITLSHTHVRAAVWVQVPEEGAGEL